MKADTSEAVEVREKIGNGKLSGNGVPSRVISYLNSVQEKLKKQFEASVCKAASAGDAVLVEELAPAESFDCSHALLGGISFHSGFSAHEQGIFQRNKWRVK